LISSLPVGLAAFMRDHVSTYEELDTLLFLASSPARAWSCEEIAESLNVTVDSIETALDALLVVGNLVQTEQQSGRSTFRYAPGSDFVRDQVAHLQRAYAEERMDVVQVMTANAMERVRSSAARRLADAFRFERSKK
jgi:predicted transcriptional regulator